MKNSRRFWSIFVLIIWVLISAMALWLVIEGVEDTLEPFVMLCVGSLSIPFIIRNAIKDAPEDDNSDAQKCSSKIKKYFGIWVVVALLPSVVLGIIDRMKGINAFDLTSLIGIFLGTLCAIILCYFFVFYLPAKKGLEDDVDDDEKTNILGFRTSPSTLATIITILVIVAIAIYTWLTL